MNDVVQKPLIRGAGGSPSSSAPRTPVQAPDSLYSIAYARVLDLISEGEIAGLVDGLKSVYLDETPIMNSDGSLNFKNVQVDARNGTPDQDYIPGFPSVEAETVVGVELESSAPWVQSITNLQLSALRIRMSTPALSRTNNTNGDVSGYRVDYAIDVATDGGAYSEVFKGAFSGKTSSTYERSHRVDLPPATSGWLIRVRRLTPNSTDTYVSDKTYIQSYTTLIDAKMRYPYSALVGLAIDASQFRSVPRRAYDMLGMIIQVPSNYNPVTRVYTGVWNGTFQMAWTNNPAWIYYAMVTNPRYGLGSVISAERVDKWALYKIAQYCDGLVPDGKGGMEPRFTCTVYLQRRADAYKVLQDLASVFRGISYWGAGQVVSVADMPEDPVYTYTNANVQHGRFTYQGSGRRARHSVALVQWSDPDDFGRGKVEYVEDEESLARYGLQETNVTAFGCTTQSQARRIGKWILFSERLETDTVNFTVGLDGTLIAPGKIIRVADADRMGKRVGGRIVSSTTTTIVVDSLPTPTPVAGDFVIVTLPTGLTEKRTIQSVGVASAKSIAVTAAFSALPVSESIWAIESTTLYAPTYRILAVTESEKTSFGITALRHEPQKFDAVELGLKVETRPTSIMPARVQAKPTGLTLTAHERAGHVLASPFLLAGWDNVTGAVEYMLQWQKDDGDWSPAQSITGTSATLDNVFMGVYSFRIWAINASGIPSPMAVSAYLTVADQSLEPGFVDLLNTSIAEALEAAENAQATADGSIVSFWQASPPVIGPADDQAKVGDIWFDTDNGNKVHRVVGTSWVEAADDDMAQAIAAATTAQATADSKVKTFFQSTAPTATGLGDLWFNTTVGVKKLFRWNGVSWSDEIADVTLDQLGGSGINVVPDEYSAFPSTTKPALFGADAYAAMVSTAGSVGGYMLRYTTQATVPTNEWIYLSSNSANYNVSVEPGDYLVSYYAYSNVAGHQVRFGSTLSVGSNSLAPAQALTTTRTRYTQKITVVAGTTAASLFMYFNWSGVASRWVYLDGVMLERLVGRREVASPYARGGAQSLALTAIAAAAASQAAADGAIDIYRQDNPPTFGPAKLGDYWQDSNDNNKWYRSNDGTSWTLVEDPRIPQAIIDAAGAQATANTRVRTWYQTAIPTAATIGDMWYSTATGVLARWDGSSWVNTADNSIAALNPNLQNPGFEQDFTGWTDIVGTGLTGWYTQGASPAPPSGTKYMVKFGGANGQSGIFNTQKVSCTVGEKFILKVNAYSASAPAGGIEIGMAWYNSVGGLISWSTSITDFTSVYCDAAFKEFSKVVDAPGNAMYGRMFIIVHGYTGVGAWAFDSVSCASYADVSAGVNMIQNSEFIQGATFWTGYSSTNISTQNEAKFLTTGAIGSGAVAYIYQDMSQNIGPSVGKKVSAQAELLNAGTMDANTRAYIYIEFYNSGMGLISTVYSMPRSPIATEQPMTAAYWHRYKIDGAIVPAGTTTIRVGAVVRGGGSYWARRFKLERGDVAGAYSPSVDMTWGGELTVVGSGRRVGDQRNLVQSLVNSYGAVRNTSAITANSSGQVTINAHTALLGGTSVSYSAVTNAVTGLTVGSRYVIYCSDAGYTGGVKTWSAAASPAAVMALGDDKYIAGEITIPSSGSGSGGLGGGGYECVDWDSVLPDGRLVRELRVGDLVPCWNGDAINPLIEYFPVLSISFGLEDSAELRLEDDALVRQSKCTPMSLLGGGVAWTMDMVGRAVVRLLHGKPVKRHVAEVRSIGLRRVVRLALGDKMFFAGVDQHATIATHNLPYKP